jgi:hypothetical protein
MSVLTLIYRLNGVHRPASAPLAYAGFQAPLLDVSQSYRLAVPRYHLICSSHQSPGVELPVRNEPTIGLGH